MRVNSLSGERVAWVNRETVALVANDAAVKPRTMRKIEGFLAKGAKNPDR